MPRKIIRTTVEESPAPVVEQKVEVPVVVEPEKKQPLDVAFTVPGKIGIISIRVVGDYVIYGDGRHMVRKPIVRGAPIFVNMRQ